MAKINFGPVVNDARGKLNGIVYSKNKSGAYSRKKVTPANPNTIAQSFVRNNFSGLAKAWSGTLTDAERASWITYATTYPRLDIFGASITLNGLNMFISLNQVLLQIGSATITTAPASNVVAPIPFDPSGFTVNHVGPSILFQQTAASPSVNSNYYIFATAPMPPGRQPQRNDFRFVLMMGPAAGPYPTPIDIGGNYAAKFGAFVAGQRVSELVATVDSTTGLTTVGTVMSKIAV